VPKLPDVMGIQPLGDASDLLEGRVTAMVASTDVDVRQIDSSRIGTAPGITTPPQVASSPAPGPVSVKFLISFLLCQ
jgi:hypothetical protein